MKFPFSVTATCCLILVLISPRLHAGEEVRHWYGQTIYVPLYSHIYADERFKDKPFNLTATLSIRNTDPEHALILLSADFYDSTGKLLQAYVSKPFTIRPLASTRYIVQESENEGGSGAKFLVRWKADKPIVAPIVESVMIGTKMQQGISFVSRGRVIKGKGAD